VRLSVSKMRVSLRSLRTVFFFFFWHSKHTTRRVRMAECRKRVTPHVTQITAIAGIDFMSLGHQLEPSTQEQPTSGVEVPAATGGTGDGLWRLLTKPSERTPTMSYGDPRSPLPDPGIGRNPPRHIHRDAAITANVILGVVVALLIAGGAVLYTMSGPSSTTAANPPATTTGQGSPRGMAPVIDEVKPAPAPATTNAPEVKQGVDAEESPTAMPKP
jgi:hypothetical protein